MMKNAKRRYSVHLCDLKRVFKIEKRVKPDLPTFGHKDCEMLDEADISDNI